MRLYVLYVVIRMEPISNSTAWNTVYLKLNSFRSFNFNNFGKSKWYSGTTADTIQILYQVVGVVGASLGSMLA